MRHLALVFVVIAAIACKKSNNAGGSGSATASGSGSAAGSAAAGSAAPGTGTAVATAPTGSSGGSNVGSGSSDEFDDKLELPKQPSRPGDQQAKVDAAADALRAVLTSAKTSKDATEFCKAFRALGKQMVGLMDVKAPSGVDPDAFSDARSKLFNKIQVANPGWCDDPAHTTLDVLRDMMDDVRDDFIALVGMGAS